MGDLRIAFKYACFFLFTFFYLVFHFSVHSAAASSSTLHNWSFESAVKFDGKTTSNCRMKSPRDLVGRRGDSGSSFKMGIPLPLKTCCELGDTISSGVMQNSSPSSVLNSNGAVVNASNSEILCL
jgi:hypothetical protein